MWFNSSYHYNGSKYACIGNRSMDQGKWPCSNNYRFRQSNHYYYRDDLRDLFFQMDHKQWYMPVKF